MLVVDYLTPEAALCGAGGQEPPLQIQGVRVLVTPDKASARRLLASCDYTRAARDPLHFAALFDRLIQNLRLYVGYDDDDRPRAEPPRHRDHLMGPPGWPTAATQLPACVKSCEREIS
jgi:hypothetical protein